MAAVPQLNSLFANPSAPAWPLSPGPSRPAATILRFPRKRRLTPVEADPRDGLGRVVKVKIPSDIAAGWLVVMALAIFGFVLF